MLHCELCGGRLVTFEGETYCPDCARYEAVEGLHRATDEALILLRMVVPEPETTDGTDIEPPF